MPEIFLKSLLKDYNRYGKRQEENDGVWRDIKK